ncbi:MAG TPA: heparinase II/III family protein [Longimicrobium sp.]|jgi:hypothetical protein
MISPTRWPDVAATLYRTFGARGAALRALHEARRAGNRFRPEPRHPITSAPLPDPHPSQADAERLAASTDREAAMKRAGRVLAGEYEAYRWDWRKLPDGPAAWLRHPRTGAKYAAAAPWWRIPHLDPAAGDIKDLWEPARFGWVYDLVRGWLLTRDDRFARSFHERLAAWRSANPPFHGPHWGCGQETAIRAVALLYAEANLADAPSSTPAAMSLLAEVLAASGERIADALGYAVSQRNNHAISEAGGLVLLGTRLRGIHPEAEGWLARGRVWLERLVLEQFTEDGWYIQHSFTYTRLALEQLALAARALDDALPESVRRRVAAAVELLGSVIDPHTGAAPNHGANDGAFIHPVTLGEYRDFRPALTAACAAFRLPMPEGLRPDPEVCAWMRLPVPEVRPADTTVRSGASGWAVARVGGWSVFLRAGRYRSRPGHLDPLQLDVRYEGREVLVDPGTFAYNAPAPWRNGLVWGRVHNTPSLDGAEPGVRGPRFLWYLWPEADIREARCVADGAVLVAEIPGRVRREVHVAPEGVTVTDTALAPAAEMRVRWLLHPDAAPQCVEVEGGATLHRAADDDVLGWYSPHYGERLPSSWWEAATPGSQIVTRIVPR